MRGLILAGGTGHRMQHLTRGTSKHLLPIHSKLMVEYPIQTLRSFGISEIQIVVMEHEYEMFLQKLGNGQQLGVTLSYAMQSQPMGIGNALKCAEDFYKNSPVCVILGDNIFFGNKSFDYFQFIRKQFDIDQIPRIISTKVQDPSNFGVLSFNSENQLIEVIEKPESSPSNVIATGLYLFDNTLAEYVQTEEISERGEFEITTILNQYLRNSRLQTESLPPEIFWTDAGTPDQYFHICERITFQQLTV